MIASGAENTASFVLFNFQYNVISSLIFGFYLREDRDIIDGGRVRTRILGDLHEMRGGVVS